MTCGDGGCIEISEQCVNQSRESDVAAGNDSTWLAYRGKTRTSLGRDEADRRRDPISCWLNVIQWSQRSRSLDVVPYHITLPRPHSIRLGRGVLLTQVLGSGALLGLPISLKMVDRKRRTVAIPVEPGCGDIPPGVKQGREGYAARVDRQ